MFLEKSNQKRKTLTIRLCYADIVVLYGQTAEEAEEEAAERERERDMDERDALVERMMEKDKTKTKKLELGGLTPSQVIERLVAAAWVGVLRRTLKKRPSSLRRCLCPTSVSGLLVYLL